MLQILTAIILSAYVVLYQTGAAPDTCWTSKSARRLNFALADYHGRDKSLAQAVGWRLFGAEENQDLSYEDYLDFVILYTDIHTDAVRYFPFCCKYSRRRLKAICAKILSTYQVDLDWKELRRMVKRREYQGVDPIRVQIY